MPVSATTLKLMMDAGLSNDAILDIVASIDEDIASLAASPRDEVKVRSGAAIRQERYRRRKAGDVTKPITRDVTRDVTSETPSPTPPTSNPTPLSPPKGDSSPLPECQSGSSAGKSIAEWVEEIWSATPQKGRQRSGKSDLTRSLTAAVRRGQHPEAIATALRAYYASPDATKDGGEFAKGVHRLVQDDRWATWAPALKLALASDPSSWSEERWATTIQRWHESGRWPEGIGPPPNDPATLAPALRASA